MREPKRFAGEPERFERRPAAAWRLPSSAARAEAAIRGATAARPRHCVANLSGRQRMFDIRSVCHNWGMVGRAATNPEPVLASIPSLPVFERLAPPASAAEYVAAIEAWTKPGEVVLDLNGRGGWVARAAIAEQRRAADFEARPLTRLLADVVLRPPD